MNKTYQGSERFVASFLVLPSAWSYNSGHTATLRLALHMSAAVMCNSKPAFHEKEIVNYDNNVMELTFNIK